MTHSSSTDPDEFKVYETDLVFALSATSATADESFSKMKNTINSIATKYGRDKFHYSVLIFGTVPSIRLKFSDMFATIEQFRRVILAIPRSRSGAALDKALSEGAKMFASPGARPNARKVLVIFTDNKTGTDKNEITKAVVSLQAQRINVVPVAVGDSVDVNELVNISPEKGDVIVSPTKESPEVLGERVIRRAMEGKMHLQMCSCCDATSFVSSSSSSLHLGYLKLERILAIFDRQFLHEEKSESKIFPATYKLGMWQRF